MASVSGIARRKIEVAQDDPSNVEFKSSEQVEVVDTFDKMGLSNDLLRGLYSYGMYCRL